MSIQQSDSRKLIVAEEVRRPRQNGSRGTSGSFQVRLRLRGLLEIMEQQGAALIQQVMVTRERMRQSEEAAEQARQLLEAHRNAGQMLEERLNRAEATVTADTSAAGGIRPSRAQVPEPPGADDGRFGFGAFAARYQPGSFSGEDTAWRDWSRVFRTWAGRFQRGRVQEVTRTAEARPGEEATVTELDLRLEEWASAELKRIAADCYHALILFCKGKALKVVLTNTEGEGLGSWRALVNKYEPTGNASVVGKLAESLRTLFEGDLLDAITNVERKIMIYEAQSVTP